MSREPNEHQGTSPHDDPDVEHEGYIDDGDEEEIPLGIMIALIVVAVGIAVIYLTVGGGHSHFH